MKKFKLDKKGSIKFVALVMSVITFASVETACNKEEKVVNTTNNEYALLHDSVEMLENELIKMFPTLNKDIIKNAALIIKLDQLAKEDANGKIDPMTMLQFKDHLDVDNMMSDFNSLIDTIEQYMFDNKEVVKMSSLLNENDSKIMAKIEKLTTSIMNGNKEEQLKNIEIIYDLFVEEKEVTYDGLTFEIRDLTYQSRAIASSYARTSAYYARNNITDKVYSKIDDRTNDQNNKSYIKIILEKMSNQIMEYSKIDVAKVFDDKYLETKANFVGKVNTEDKNTENLINYLNIEYLDSEDVAHADKSRILGEYEEEDLKNVLVTVDAITTYNQKNKDDIILLSNLLIDDYKATETGKFDALTLDFMQYNVYMFLSTTKAENTKYELYNNPYFQNINNYLVNGTFTYKTKEKQYSINYQDMSDGVKLICNEMVIQALYARKNIFELEGYEKKIAENLEDSIKYIEQSTSGECKSVDVKYFIKK